MSGPTGGQEELASDTRTSSPSSSGYVGAGWCGTTSWRTRSSSSGHLPGCPRPAWRKRSPHLLGSRIASLWMASTRTGGDHMTSDVAQTWSTLTRRSRSGQSASITYSLGSADARRGRVTRRLLSRCAGSPRRIQFRVWGVASRPTLVETSLESRPPAPFRLQRVTRENGTGWKQPTQAATTRL